MMASVSIVARESLRVSTVSLLRSQDRSSAVRKVHLPPIRTRLTPRVAYSCCSLLSAAPTSTPSGKRAPKSFSLSGSDAANSMASSNRSSSGLGSLAPSESSRGLIILVARLMAAASFSLTRAAAGGRCTARSAHVIVCSVTLAHIERRKRLVLVNVRKTLAHQFQRAGEARCEHRRRQRRLDDIGDQVFIQSRPVGASADQALQGLARLRQRPDGSLSEAQMGERLALPLLRISSEQIV